MNKKILFIVDNYAPHIGGAEVVYQCVAEHLARQGCKVDVLTTAHPDREKIAAINGVTVHSSFKSRYWFTFFGFFQAWRLSRDTDIIQTATYNAAPVAWLVGKLRGKPVVLMVHELLNRLWLKQMNWLSGTLHFLFERFVTWLSFDQYIAVSEFTKGQLLDRGIPEKKIKVIHHGIDGDLFSPSNADPGLRARLGYSPDDFVLLFFGRPGVIKGAKFLVEAMRNVQNPCVKLLMLLPDEKTPGGDQIAQEALKNPQIRLESSVSRTQLPHYLNMADAVVVPSLQEGFGFSAAEACACGRPVIASRAGALPETVSGKVIWTEPGSADSLAEGIEKATRGEWQIIPERHFSWETSLQEYENLYNPPCPPLRIAIIADPIDEQYAGIYTYTKNLIENLVKIDRENEYIFVHTKKNPFFREKGKEVIIPLWKWIPGFMAFRKFVLIPLALLGQKIDVVHDPAHVTPFLFFPTKAKQIVTIHDLTPVLHPEWHPWASGFFHKLLLPLVFRRVDHIIAVSESTKRDIQKRYHPKCPIAVTYQAAREKLPVKPLNLKTPFLLHVGTIEPRKNLAFLFKVFEYLKTKHHIPHHLYLVGKKGWKCQLFFSALTSSPVKDDITWSDFVPEENLPAYFSQADCLVFPTLYEGLGLPALEAMQYGCPVTASNNSSMPEVVGEGGLLADETSAENFGCAILEVLQNRERFRQNAITQSQKFNWEKCARETLKIYERLSSPRK